MKKAIVFILSAVLAFTLGASLSACGNKDEGIYFLNFKPEAASVYNEIAAAYEKETGVRVKVVTAAANTYEQTLKSEAAKSSPPTIFQINGPVGYAAWKDYCLDLGDSKLYSLLSDKTLAVKDGDGVYGIPYVIEGYGIICNTALTDKYFALENRESGISSLDEVNNFAALKALAEDMTAHKSELGIDGVFASTSLSSGEDWRWQTHLANVPFYYELSELGGDPTTAGLAARSVAFKYAENYKNLFDLYLDNSVTARTLLGSKSVSDSMAEFALSKAVMVQNGNWAWSQINEVAGNTVERDKIRFLPLYTGMDGEERQGLCIGTENYLAINSKVSAEKQQQSLDFLYWLFASETGKRFVTEKLDFITPFSSFTEDELPADPLAREISAWLKRDNTVSVPWVFTAFPGENFKRAFGDALLGYAQGGGDFDAVKRSVTEAWQKER